MSKVITELLWFCLTTLCDWFKNLAPKTIATWSHAFSRVWRRLRVFAPSSHWFITLLSFVVIGHCNCFGLVFDTQLKTTLLPIRCFIFILLQSLLDASALSTMVTAYSDKLERVLSCGTAMTPSGLLPRLRGTYTRLDWETLWPNGYHAVLRIERSWFKPWPGSLCCVLGQDTCLSQCLSPPRSTNGYRRQSAGDYLWWTSIPSRGSSNTPSRFMLQKQG